MGRGHLTEALLSSRVPLDRSLIRAYSSTGSDLVPHPQFFREFSQVCPHDILNMAQERDIQLGKYQLKTRLGKGGMGVVYLATDSRLKRDVAVKILPRSLASNPVAVKRFLREARVAASISHPSIVTIHDVDQINGQCFLVMELMTGGTAQDLLQRGPLDWKEATRIIADTCHGLAAIHEAGLIHRDIKPSNIMLAPQGVVKLADFGLAKLTDSATESKPLTVSNTILGTPQFMSPEQCQGDELDSRCDLYSLGATYFALLTGAAPFPDPQPLQCMFAHCSAPVPDPRKQRSEIPAECVAVIMKAMAKKRADRFESAREMLAALRACLNPGQSASTGGVTTTTGVPTLNPGDSMSFGVSSAEPWATTSPIVNPGQTTVIMKTEADVNARRRMILAIAAGSSALLIGLLFWSGVGRSNSGQTEARPSKLGMVGPGNSSWQPNKPIHSPVNQKLNLKFEAEFPVLTTQVSGVAFADDDKSFFSGSMEGTVQEWSVASRQPVRSFAGVNKGIRAIAARRNWLVAGGEAKTVWLWNVGSDQPRATLTNFEGEISSLAISPDGKKLAVGTYSELHLYRLNDTAPKLIKVLGKSTNSTVICYMVMSVAFSSDSQWIGATSWADKAVAAWNAETGALRDVKLQQMEEPDGLSFIPDEDRLVFATQHQGIFIWDLNRQTIERLAASQPGDRKPRTVRSLLAFPDSQTVAAVGQWGGLICLYNLHQKSDPVENSQATSASSYGLDISADGRLLLLSGGDQEHGKGFIQLWKVVREPSE